MERKQRWIAGFGSKRHLDSVLRRWLSEGNSSDCGRSESILSSDSSVLDALHYWNHHHHHHLARHRRLPGAADTFCWSGRIDDNADMVSCIRPAVPSEPDGAEVVDRTSSRQRQ